MDSQIAKKLKLKYFPVAVLFTNEKPPDAVEFIEGRWGCVAAMVTAAAKGRRAVFSRTTFGCMGAGVGLGFINHYQDGMEYDLCRKSLKKTPDLAKSFTKSTPLFDHPEQYVELIPLTEVDPAKEEPKIIVIYANPDQLTALVALANYGRADGDNVIVPSAAGCQSICMFPWSEANREVPRAVIGLLDITIRPLIDADLLSFSMPYAMFKEMENNIPDSFLNKPEWDKVAKRIPSNPV